MTNNIHPTAIIYPGAIIDKTADVGPYCVIGSNVVLKANVKLYNNVIIDGDTVINEGTSIYPFATIGLNPQDLKFNNENSQVIIGKNNTIREHVTIHKGTQDGGMLTKVGDNCLIMVGVHLAHDVILGNNVIISNSCLIAGHVIVEDNVIISGGSAVHQFCRLGEGCFIGGMSGVNEDIVPYAMFTGARNDAEINGVNLVGLRRKGISKEDIHAIADMYKILFSKEDSFKNNLDKVKQQFANIEYINKIIKFIESTSSRPLCTKFRNR